MAFGFITDIGQIGLWIQGVGLLVVLWIIVQSINLFFNRKRRLLLESINERLKSVEYKIDKISKRKN